MSSGKRKLAILGGEPAVTIKNPEQWIRPVEEEKKAVCELIDSGFLEQYIEAFRKVCGNYEALL